MTPFAPFLLALAVVVAAMTAEATAASSSAALPLQGIVPSVMLPLLRRWAADYASQGNPAVTVTKALDIGVQPGVPVSSPPSVLPTLLLLAGFSRGWGIL